MKDCNPIDTQFARGKNLSKEMGPKTLEEKREISNVFYSNVVGSLMYAMKCTRPDICYAIGMGNHFQANPGMMHWKAVKRILRYLKGTMDYSFLLSRQRILLSGLFTCHLGR